METFGNTVYPCGATGEEHVVCADNLNPIAAGTPEPPQTEPKEAVTIREPGFLRLSLERGELVAVREVLECEIAPRPKS